MTCGESITIQPAPAMAVDSRRDALTKTIYGAALFLWVVSVVNKSVIWSNESEVRYSTGVLDMPSTVLNSYVLILQMRHYSSSL